MKRSLIIIIHTLAVLLAIAGLSILYIASPNGYGISWTKEERYEDTPQFSEQFNQDIGNIKTFINLQDAFEGEEGELDMDAVVADAEIDGMYEPFSLREAMQTAQRFGCYLDPNTYEISINASEAANAKNSDYEIKVNYKYYDPHYFENIPIGPGVGVTTAKKLSYEVMRALSEYYHLRASLMETQGNLYFSAHYMNESGEYEDLTNTDMSAEELAELGKYIYVFGDSQKTNTNIDPVPENALNLETEFSPNDDEDEYIFFAAVDTSYPYDDAYKRAALRFEGDIRVAYLAAGMLAVGLLVCLASMIMILRFDGYENREAALRLRPIDKLPYEIYLFLCVTAAAAGCFIMSLTGLRIARTLAPSDQWNYWRKVLNAAVIYAVFVYALLGTLRRMREEGIFKNTLIYGLIADLNDYVNRKSISGTLFLRYAAFVGGNLLLFLLLIWLYLHREEGTKYLTAFAAGLLLLAGADLYVFKRLYTEAKQQDQLNEVLNHLSEGDTDFAVEEDKFTGREHEIAKRLNHISTGMRTALSEQVKSERLKADLITNVSHDIRTPLTSIINYVDLLKREDIQDEKVREYIQILDQKSVRLKNLTEDLLEASKASSGNIKMDMQKIDLVELSLQAGAEFEDKFAAKELELCLGAPEHPVFISADGRHLWRVLENLYNNAAKYSMEHTRVYADILEQDGKAVFTIKNISANKLNISPDELTERFVRGDVSRSTEGSGLGLSIATSLTKLQGGELVIEIDGDLYKANVIFPRYEEPKTAEADRTGSAAAAENAAAMSAGGKEALAEARERSPKQESEQI